MNLVGTKIHDRYIIEDKIGEGGMSTVWLGVNLKDNSEVAIKILKKGVTSNRIEDIIRFRNEANIVSKLNIPGTVKIYEADEVEGLQYIVMEYIKGKSLQSLLSEGRHFTTEETLSIIYNICEVLKKVHDTGIIYRDLKPGNIIIDDQNNKEIKLIDFGLSQMREFDYREASQIIGTLYYMSPEQSGIIKRVIDERSDLYSLGVIFYQMVTNRLPFYGDNINSLVHQHAVKIPEDPRNYNSSLSDIIVRIILKLLKKEPEERYQSAQGLQIDLEKIRKGQVEFTLSSNDTLSNLHYRTSLVGRDEEYGILKQMYENASEGNGGICLISGEAGSGKSRLSDELKSYALKSEGLFIDGKCFAGENKIPYSVFKDALNAYVKLFKMCSEEKRAFITNKIKNAIGDLGKIIIKLNPQTYEILGECSEPVELEPDSENNRFKMIVSRFIYALGNNNKPLVILLEDLQWVDEGSISLLTELSDKINEYPVLVIGTYRINEVDKNHILSTFFKISKDNGCLIKEIKLKHFNDEAMISFMSKLLYYRGTVINRISDFVLKKSEGNPFFAMEVLKQMINEKAIQKSRNQWILMDDILERIQIPSSAVDILIKRISTLTDSEKYVLSYAAVIGKRFNISFLFQLINLKQEEVLEIVDKGLKMQFLEQSNDEKGELSFVHDRIQEAFCIILDGNEAKKAHLNIAYILEKANNSDTDKNVFDLTYHYYEGKDLQNALKYAIPSGEKAKISYAYEAAYRYYILAKTILDNESDKDRDELRFTCIIKLAEVCTYIGKNNEAIILLEDILPNIKSNEQNADIYLLICNAYYNMGDYGMSYKYGKKGLSYLGEYLPNGKPMEILAILKELIIRLVYSIKNKPIYTRRIKKDNSELYEKIHLFYRTLNMVTPYYDVVKFVYGIIRGLNIVERRIGWDLDLGFGIGGFGGFMAATGNFETSIKYFSKAVDIFTELNAPLGLADEYQFMAISNEFMGDYTMAREILEKSIELLTGICDVKGLCFSLQTLIHQYYYPGEYEDMLIMINRYMDYYNKTRDMYIKNSCNVFKAQYYREIGKYEKSLECGSYIMDSSYEVKDLFNYCALNIELGITYLEKGDVQSAIECLEKAKAINEKNTFFPQWTVYLYPYLAEAYIIEYMEKYTMAQQKEKLQLLKKIRNVCGLAIKKTAKLPTHYGISLRIMGKYNHLIGNVKKAEALYKRSIEHYTLYNRKYELGKNLYTYGVFLYSGLRHNEAYNYIQRAYNIFKELNSAIYIKQCEKLLGLSDVESGEISTRVTQNIRVSQQLSSITSLAQQISSILDLDTLLDQIMQTVLEITGAQNGYLFMMDNRIGELRLVVSKTYSETIEYDINSISKGILNKVMESGETVISINALEDERYSAYDSVLVNEIKSVLCFPIKYNQELKAICYLDNKISSSVFTEDDISLLSIIITQASISIENAELYRMATTDGLTDLVTHKHFLTLLDKEIQRSKRYGRVFSLLIFDVDGFKMINDTYGHQAGDEVLEKIAKVTKENLRHSDVVARYGGDEFAIILPETDAEKAFLCAEKLRKIIEGTTVYYEGSNLCVTLSIGITQYPKDTDKDKDLIKYADKSLYASKQKGGNMSVVYSDSFSEAVQVL